MLRSSCKFNAVWIRNVIRRFTRSVSYFSRTHCIMLIYTSRLLQPHVFLFFFAFSFRCIFLLAWEFETLPDLTFTFTHASAANDRFSFFKSLRISFVSTHFFAPYWGHANLFHDERVRRLCGDIKSINICTSSIVRIKPCGHHLQLACTSPLFASRDRLDNSAARQWIRKPQSVLFIHAFNISAD